MCQKIIRWYIVSLILVSTWKKINFLTVFQRKNAFLNCFIQWYKYSCHEKQTLLCCLLSFSLNLSLLWCCLNWTKTMRLTEEKIVHDVFTYCSCLLLDTDVCIIQFEEYDHEYNSIHTPFIASSAWILSEHGQIICLI